MSFNFLIGKKKFVSLLILLRNYVNAIIFVVNSRKNFKMIKFIFDAFSALAPILVSFSLFLSSFLS